MATLERQDVRAQRGSDLWCYSHLIVWNRKSPTATWRYHCIFVLCEQISIEHAECCWHRNFPSSQIPANNPVKRPRVHEKILCGGWNLLLSFSAVCCLMSLDSSWLVFCLLCPSGSSVFFLFCRESSALGPWSCDSPCQHKWWRKQEHPAGAPLGEEMEIRPVLVYAIWCSVWKKALSISWRGLEYHTQVKYTDNM